MIRLYLCLLIIFQGSRATMAQSFPDQVTGTWTGVMHMYKDGQKRDSVTIRFTVRASSPNAWSWKTEYLSDKMPMTKDYTLKLVNEATKTYALDEGDGVVLNDYLFGNKLYSVFETHEVMLTSSYELRGDELIFEVTSGKKVAGSKDISNYSVQHLQRAVLRRSP